MDGVCDLDEKYGCTDVNADNYDVTATENDGSCIFYGCTDEAAFNYNADANTDDGSCEEFFYGCTDDTAFNYNADANTDDGSCEEVVYGCKYPKAFNYVENANTEDGSCEVCNEDTACNYIGTEVYSFGDWKYCDDSVYHNCCFHTGDPECGIVGDINGDDNLNVIDVVLLIQMVLNAIIPEEYYEECSQAVENGLDYCPQAYIRPDLNKDEVLNVQDVILVIHKVINSE